MPAHEFEEWRAFFSIYPFTQEREDYRTALLAATISNMSGKKLKQSLDIEAFLPDHLQTRPKEKTLEQQRADKEAFKAKLRAAQRGINANR